MKIIVVGAGFGGLAAAIRLRARGHEVTVVEKRDQPGGRAAVFRQDGFTFDAGPTIITAPQLIEQLFAVAGRRMVDHVRLVPVDPFYRVRFVDGTSIDWNRDKRAREAAVSRLSPSVTARAIPKSVTRGRSVPRSSRMLSGLMSRCTTPRAWA